jgi:hypothetical protein
MRDLLSAVPRFFRHLSIALIVLGLVQISQAPVFAAPRADDENVADPFLNRLLDEINIRRDAVGTPRLVFVPRPANDALNSFLGYTAPTIAWPGPCMHQLINGGYSWDYMQAATGFDAEARGEVLACPGPEPYWTPDRAAEQWWESPVHFDVLYADWDANAVACSAYGTQGMGGKKNRTSAAMAVLCVTFHE